MPAPAEGTVVLTRAARNCPRSRRTREAARYDQELARQRGEPAAEWRDDSSPHSGDGGHRGPSGDAGGHKGGRRRGEGRRGLPVETSDGEYSISGFSGYASSRAGAGKFYSHPKSRSLPALAAMVDIMGRVEVGARLEGAREMALHAAQQRVETDYPGSNMMMAPSVESESVSTPSAMQDLPGGLLASGPYGALLSASLSRRQQGQGKRKPRKGKGRGPGAGPPPSAPLGRSGSHGTGSRLRSREFSRTQPIAEPKRRAALPRSTSADHAVALAPASADAHRDRAAERDDAGAASTAPSAGPERQVAQHFEAAAPGDPYAMLTGAINALAQPGTHMSAITPGKAPPGSRRKRGVPNRGKRATAVPPLRRHGVPALSKTLARAVQPKRPRQREPTISDLYSELRRAALSAKRRDGTAPVPKLRSVGFGQGPPREKPGLHDDADGVPQPLLDVTTEPPVVDVREDSSQAAPKRSAGGSPPVLPSSSPLTPADLIGNPHAPLISPQRSAVPRVSPDASSSPIIFRRARETAAEQADDESDPVRDSVLLCFPPVVPALRGLWRGLLMLAVLAANVVDAVQERRKRRRRYREAHKPSGDDSSAASQAASGPEDDSDDDDASSRDSRSVRARLRDGDGAVPPPPPARPKDRMVLVTASQPQRRINRQVGDPAAVALALVHEPPRAPTDK